MFVKCIFKCPAPAPMTVREIEMFWWNCYFGEDFIVASLSEKRTNIPELHLEHNTRYLLLCNRFTRAWTFIRFPGVHAASGNTDESFKFIGFFRPTVIAVLYTTHVDDYCEVYLELWELSATLDSVRIVHVVRIALDATPLFPRCVGFYPIKDKIRLVLQNIVDDPAYRCVVVDCATTSAADPVETFTVDVHPHEAMMHNGKMYLLCNEIDRVEQKVLYEYANGRLKYVTSLADAVPLSLIYLYSSSGSKLFVVNYWGGYLVAFFDVATRLWTRCTPNPHFSDYVPYHTFGGEVLCYESANVNGREICELRIFSILPPKLSVFARRAIQENMPKETAKKIALEKGVDGSIKFAMVLLSSNNNLMLTV